MIPVVTPFTLVHVEEEAETLLRAARAKAIDLLRQAVQEAEKLREQARAEGSAVGRREGLQQGLEEGRAQGLREERAKAEAAVPDALRALQALGAALREERSSLHHAAERHLLRLACAIAARVVKAEVARDPLSIQRNVQELIALAATRRDLTLRIHPQDEQALRHYLPTLAKTYADLDAVAIVTDPAVSRGGCLTTLPAGGVDLQIETQLAQIEAVLLGESGTQNA